MIDNIQTKSLIILSRCCSDQVHCINVGFTVCSWCQTENMAPPSIKCVEKMSFIRVICLIGLHFTGTLK